MRKLLVLLIVVICTQCKEKEELKLLVPHKEFIDHITEGNDSFYSIRKSKQTKLKNSYAIGVFDSGIGGLTVFDAIINADFFNLRHENIPDGIKDFEHEQFVYLADQANMPYSNYVEEEKKELLVEHILKDALFLYNTKYYPSANTPETADDKPNIKAIVIACNTATAYGKPHVEELLKIAGADIKVIGVIDAGCKGTFEVIGKDEDAAIAIFATPATVSSQAYVNTLNDLKKDHSGKIRIIQQGGKGLHESIDNKSEFINSNYKKPYPEYQGPSLWDKQYKIESHLLPFYNFDTSDFQVLYNRSSLEMSDTIELNSVENYTRYHVVSIAEQLKEAKDTIPLKAIVLGCTHYPYVSDIIDEVLDELREVERYNYLIADTVFLIDPALNTAKELYNHLSDNELLNDSEEKRLADSHFFMSVPNIFEPSVETEPGNGFTYEYQYIKRDINQLKDFTLIVPFSRGLISDEQMSMIQKRLPDTYRLIEYE